MASNTFYNHVRMKNNAGITWINKQVICGLLKLYITRLVFKFEDTVYEKHYLKRTNKTVK